MKVLIFAPNAGVSLSTGGGTSFVLRQAAAAVNLGHEVVLAGYHSLPLSALQSIHRIIVGEKCRVVSAGTEVSYRVARQFPVKVSPYIVLFLRGFRRFVNETLKAENPDLIWFHDDIPLTAAKELEKRVVSLYVHFPVRARRTRLVPVLRRARTAFETMVDVLDSSVSPVVRNPYSLTTDVWVNSLVTYRVVKELWGASPRGTGYTYVEAGAGPTAKSDEITCVGSLSRGKGQLDVIEAFDAADLPGFKLNILGHLRDASQYRRIVRRVKAAKKRSEITVLPDAPAGEIVKTLGRSRIIVSAAEFEPFGLAMLEGMSMGAAAIAREGPYSGPWLDILQEGRWGSGFQTPQELSKIFETTASSERLPRLGYERARAFNKAGFETWMAERLL